ncbi:MAG: glycosyltransferase, partial [Methanobacteriota archaeon]
MSDSAHATNGSAAAVENGTEAAAMDDIDATAEREETGATGDADTAAAGEPYTFDDLSVVMGTYNEEAAIATVLEDIDEVTNGRAEVVCVDGSADRTPEIAREHGARVIEQEPQGYGVAVREAVLTPDRPVVVTTDCDDTYPMTRAPCSRAPSREAV